MKPISFSGFLPRQGGEIQAGGDQTGKELEFQGEEELQGHANRGRPAWGEVIREEGDQGKKPEIVDQKLGSMVGSKLIMLRDGVISRGGYYILLNIKVMERF